MIYFDKLCTFFSFLSHLGLFWEIVSKAYYFCLIIFLFLCYVYLCGPKYLPFFNYYFYCNFFCIDNYWENWLSTTKHLQFMHIVFFFSAQQPPRQHSPRPRQRPVHLHSRPQRRRLPIHRRQPQQRHVTGRHIKSLSPLPLQLFLAMPLPPSRPGMLFLLMSLLHHPLPLSPPPRPSRQLRLMHLISKPRGPPRPP